MITPVLAFEEMRLPIELYLASLIFLLPFAPRKKHFGLRVLSSFLIGMGVSLLFFVIFKSKENPQHYYFLGVWYPLISLSAIIFSKYCFIINYCDAIYIDIAAYASQHIVYAIVNEQLARVVFPEIRNYLFLYIFISLLACSIVYGCIYCLFGRQLYKCNGVLFDETPEWIAINGSLFLLMIAILCFFQSMFENRSFSGHESFWIAGLVCSFLLLFMYYMMFAFRSEVKENAILQKHLNNNEKYYHMTKEQIEIINRKCHDLKHTLKILASASEQDRQTYIEEVQKNIVFYQNLVYSDNDVINTILAEKGLLCSEKNIHFSCAIDHTDLSFIKLADLYAILGNALDNAIEYVEQLNDETQRIINLRIMQNQQFISIQVDNPYYGPIISSHELPPTTKENSFEHGFGLKSIRYLSSLYHGWFEISTKDKLFTLQILIPIENRDNI